MATPKTPAASSEAESRNIDQLVSTLRNDAPLRVFLSDEILLRAPVGAALLSQCVSVAFRDAQRASKISLASVRQRVIQRKVTHWAKVMAVDLLEKEYPPSSQKLLQLLLLPPPFSMRSVLYTIPCTRLLIN